jgi:hypothetical protein
MSRYPSESPVERIGYPALEFGPKCEDEILSVFWLAPLRCR